MQPIVEVEHLLKEFKTTKAVNDVSFSIQKGEVVAILGPNGAGKTTTMLMMLGLLQPTKGTVKLFGGNPKDLFVREQLGVMLQDVSLMDGLKVKELIHLFRSYYPNPLSMEKLIRYTGLTEKLMNKRTEKLSGGEKRKVGFSLALVGNPDFLMFDEPTVGMDISARNIFWKTIQELARLGKTIMFSTHYLQEADDSAKRILLFHQGKLIADGKPEEIKKKLTRQSVSFISDTPISKKLFSPYSFITDVFVEGKRTYLVTDDTDQVLELLFRLEINGRNIRIEKGRLEEAFTQLTKEEEMA